MISICRLTPDQIRWQQIKGYLDRVPIPVFDLANLQAISDVLGDTQAGLTGGQIGQLLAQSGIADSDVSTKRHRLFDALARRQARRSWRCSMILAARGLALRQRRVERRDLER